jgi:hypothetical protein
MKVKKNIHTFIYVEIHTYIYICIHTWEKLVKKRASFFVPVYTWFLNDMTVANCLDIGPTPYKWTSSIFRARFIIFEKWINWISALFVFLFGSLSLETHIGIV